MSSPSAPPAVGLAVDITGSQAVLTKTGRHLRTPLVFNVAPDAPVEDAIDRLIRLDGHRPHVFGVSHIDTGMVKRVPPVDGRHLVAVSPTPATLAGLLDDSTASRMFSAGLSRTGLGAALLKCGPQTVSWSMPGEIFTFRWLEPSSVSADTAMDTAFSKFILAAKRPNRSDGLQAIDFLGPQAWFYAAKFLASSSQHRPGEISPLTGELIGKATDAVSVLKLIDHLCTATLQHDAFAVGVTQFVLRYLARAIKFVVAKVPLETLYVHYPPISRHFPIGEILRTQLKTRDIEQVNVRFTDRHNLRTEANGARLLAVQSLAQTS